MLLLTARRWLLAYAVLTAPANAPEPDLSRAELYAVRRLAVQLELIEASEAGYASLEACRRGWFALHDCPTLADCGRLPNQRTCLDMRDGWRAYRDWLGRVTIMRRHQAAAIQREMDEAHEAAYCWSLAVDAQSRDRHLQLRRQSLREIRDRVGPATWARMADPATRGYDVGMPAP